MFIVYIISVSILYLIMIRKLLLDIKLWIKYYIFVINVLRFVIKCKRLFIGFNCCGLMFFFVGVK